MELSTTQRLQNYFIRSMRASRDLEYFMLAAIATILGVRLFLVITGYPSVGGSELHIAHVLYGGILMLAALMMLFIFLNRGAEVLAALVGGAGFGLFIDEVGKFVTRDNNYFFQPTAAIIYVVFVLIFLVSRYILTRRHFTHTEYLMNSINEMRELPKGRMREDVKADIVHHLTCCSGDDPLALNLKQFIERQEAGPAPTPGLYDRLKDRANKRYRRIVTSRWFPPAIIALFSIQLLGALAVILTILFDINNIAEDLDLFSFSDWAILASEMISSFFVLWGMLLLVRRDRLRSYRMFERAMLISIFLTQFFLFYRDAFGAVPGFVFDLLVLLAIRFLIQREESIRARGEAPGETGGMEVAA